MQIDQGRNSDLEELSRGMKNAKSVAERQHYQKLAFRLVNESTKVTSLRRDMIAAFRASDTNKVKRIQMQIQHARLEETSGASWGSNRGQRKII